MKILYVADIRLPTEKAHGLAIMRMCDAFVDTGAEVELLVPSRSNPIEADPFEYYGIAPSFKITKLEVPDTVSRGRFGFWRHAYRFARAAAAYAKKQKPDIVYSRDALPLYFLLRSGLALYWEAHVPKKNFIVQRVARSVRGIICISKGLEDWYRGLDAQNILVAQSGVGEEHLLSDPEARARVREMLAIAEDQPVVEYFGAYETMGAGKGVDGIIEGFARFRSTRSDAILLLAGVGDVAPLYAAIEARGIPKSFVRVIEHVPHKEVPAYLKAADMLVMFFPRAEHYEHFMSPMKVFEYMASGVPVVTSDLPSIREVLDDSTALFVEPGDVKALARAFQETLQEKAHSAQRAEQARMQAQKYTWDARADAVARFCGLPHDDARVQKEQAAAEQKPPSSSTCAFCGSSDLYEVIDFGDVAIAGAFLKKEEIESEKKYRLTVAFCKKCYAVQVMQRIDPTILFATDFYFSSAIKTLRDHFIEYAAEVTARFLPEPEKAVVVEFGSNDGVLLKPFADQGVGTVIGIEPAGNIAKTVTDPRLTVINDFYSVGVANDIVQKYGTADIVCGNNVYAHIADINAITEAITATLKDDGVFIFEVHYLGKILEDMQYDMIYHEHVYYYSQIALQNHLARHGMVIFDIKPIPIHGGSVRYYAAKTGSKYAQNISAAVDELCAREHALGYDKSETYGKFASRVAQKKGELMDVLTRLKKEGKTIAGYGASGRANTIIQYCGINDSHLAYMIDDAPAKQGLYTPGSHLPIRGSDILKSDPPEYVLVFAWTFFKEIAAKSSAYFDGGGKMIVPLPEVRTIDHA